MGLGSGPYPARVLAGVSMETGGFAGGGLHTVAHLCAMRFVAGQQHHEDFQLQSWQGGRTPLQEEVAVISTQLQHRLVLSLLLILRNQSFRWLGCLRYEARPDCPVALALCFPAVGQDKKPLSKEVKALIEEGDAKAQHSLGLMCGSGLDSVAETCRVFEPNAGHADRIPNKRQEASAHLCRHNDLRLRMAIPGRLEPS